MRVFLAYSHKYNWFASGVHHIESSTHFVIDSIKLGHDDAINSARVIVLDSIVNKLLIKFSELIDSIIPNKSFPHKQNYIRIVHMN